MLFQLPILLPEKFLARSSKPVFLYDLSFQRLKASSAQLGAVTAKIQPLYFLVTGALSSVNGALIFNNGALSFVNGALTLVNSAFPFKKWCLYLCKCSHNFLFLFF